MTIKTMTIDDAVSDFVNHLRHERMSPSTTVNTYNSSLHLFCKWLGQSGREDADLSALTTPTLREYQYSLSARSLRPRTIRGSFHALRSLGAFLVARGVIEANPCTGLTMPKKDAAVRLTVSQAEVVALIENAHRLYPERKAKLAQAMVSVFVYTGLRYQEALDLRTGDVNLSAGTLLVASGKGDKSRLLYPPPPCLAALASWMELRTEESGRRGIVGTDWLWAENGGRRVGHMGFRDLLEEAKAAAGLGGRENIKPHSLRHFFATNLDQNGAPLKVIQAALGHSSAQTTLIYLHSTERDSQRMADFSRLGGLTPMPPSSPPPAPPARAPEPKPKPHALAAQNRLRRQGPTRKANG